MVVDSKDPDVRGVDEEIVEKKIPYPKSIIFIVSQEFCERFCYYGMRTVLSLYLVGYLFFEENESKMIFHIFAALCYATPVIGAIIADSFLGKFKTIFYLSIVYAAGSIILSLASAEQVGLHPRAFSLIGLALIAIGTGGIKPCVAAFGGDQFVLPNQSVQLASFFSVFYFAINAGSLISSTITPIFRKDVDCSEAHTCYPLAFSVPAALMIISLIIFLIGKPFYKINPPEGANIAKKVFKCIGHAITQKWTNSGSRRDHWLDYAEELYGKIFIEDTKCLLNVLSLYVTIPVFWALYDQQGSTWTFQANRCDGYTLGYVIKPDQFQVINALLILAFIPLFDKGVYPFLAKHNILTRPLQRMTTGGILAGVAFIASGLLELKLQTTYPVLPQAGEVNLNFMNTLPCSVNLTLLDTESSRLILPNENSIYETVNAQKYTPHARIIPNEDFACKSFSEGLDKENLEADFAVDPSGGHAYSMLIVVGKSKTMKIVNTGQADDLMKAEGDSKIKIIYDGFDETAENITIELRSDLLDENPKPFKILPSTAVSEQQTISPLQYTVILRLNSIVEPFDQYERLGKIEVASGGNYILSIAKNHTNMNGSAGHNQPFAITLHTITKPNSVHILWLTPQYVILTVAEIMFSISGLEFSYSQAPDSMKSLVQAAWLLTTAFGNLIVVGISKSELKQSNELFLYAGIMFVGMKIFGWMAYFYKAKKIGSKSEPIETNGHISPKIEIELN